MSGKVEAEITKFLLQGLKELVTEYINLKAGAKHEFLMLNNELDLLGAFLTDQARMCQRSDDDFNFFRVKERQIRELVYDVEDCIQTCFTKKAAAKRKIVGRIKHKISTSMETKVKSLRQLRVTPVITEITNRYGNMHHNEGPSTSSETPRKERIITDQLSKLEKVVDFKDEATVLKYLEEPKTELDVIFITGMPGLGKTTFARKIFEHKTIVPNFPLRSWIRISQSFNIMDMLLNILKSSVAKGTPAPPISSEEEEELVKTVQGCLDGKKFLLVMDDIWTFEDWEKIRKILPMNNGMGKVLVTTRDTAVARRANLARGVHELSELDEIEGFKLLKWKVLNNLERSWPTDLDDIGKRIVQKCNGVPLVILLIGGVLNELFASTQSLPAVKNAWEKVLIVDDKLKEDKMRLISTAIELSYKRLSHDLRLCFLYMGLFPENDEIQASTLTKLWIAEGFIQRNDGSSMEDTAKEILESLINMNLLMVAKKNLDQVKTCRVHDMIRAFCITKAEEQNLFRVIKASNRGELEPLETQEQPLIRRLCLHSNPSDIQSEILMGSCVRSFLCFFKEPSNMNTTHAPIIPNDYNFLRVLNCKSIKFREFPEVTRLILLKHISLYIDNLNVLPKQISELLNLQTLIVYTESQSITVKANIWEMIQLRRLKTKAAISLKGQNGKGKARVNLHTVSRLSPDSCNEALSERAPYLKTLGIRGKLANLFDNFSLENFIHLEKLKLVNDLKDESAASSNSLFGHRQQNRVPTNINNLQTLSNNPLCLTLENHFPPNLKRLSLSKTHLKWAHEHHHMQILARITTLNVLKLKDDAFTGKSWQVGTVVFPQLEFLLIQKTDLEDWNASDINFPNLRWLVIESCKQLKAIPESLGSLKYLEKLEIQQVKKSVAESAMKIESIKKEAEQNPESISILAVPLKLTIGPGCSLP